MQLGAFKLNSISASLSSGAPTGKTVTLNGGGVIRNFVKDGWGRSYQNPTASAYISVGQHTDFAFGTSTDFTVEGWVWFGKTISNKYLFDGRPDANSLAILMDGSYLKVYIAGAYRISSVADAAVANYWNHIAYTRQGTTGALWLNGSRIGTWTDTTNYTHSNDLTLMSRYVAGQGAEDSFCTQFRISNSARYDAANTTYTTPTSPWAGDANTLLLLHFDDASGSTTTTDSSAITSYTPVTFSSWDIVPSIATITETSPTNRQYYSITGPTASANYYMKYSVGGVDQGTTVPSTDLSDFSTSGFLTNNTWQVFAEAKTDTTTEGTESLVAYVYSDSGRTTLVATSDTTSISDTSIAPPSFTYVGQGSSLATTVTIPAIAAVGDIAVLFDTSTTTTLTVPSGFTQINSVSTTGIRTTYSYKQLVSGDPGASITGMAGTTRKLLLVFRPSVTPSSITAVSNAGQATSQVPTNQSLPLLAALEPNLAFAVYGWTTSTPTRTWTQTGSTATITTNNSTSGISVYYEINNAGSNPQNATISMTDGGTNTMMTGYIRFT